jgi:dTMP kinase
VVIDGVEGCGKTTQVGLLADYLKLQGRQVVLTHEPGGTPVGAHLRTLLLQLDVDISPSTETFLFCTDRAEHVRTVVAPALAAGQWVVSDRFSSATFAYQVWAGGTEEEVFAPLDEMAREPLARVAGRADAYPDLTIILDMEPAVGLRRKMTSDQALDRIERKGETYHCRVREGFLEYARRGGDRAVVLSGESSPGELHERILAALELTS